MNVLKRIITGVLLVAFMVGVFALRQLVDVRFFSMLVYLFSLVGTFEVLRAFDGKITVLQRLICIAYALTLAPVFTFLSMQAAVVESFVAVLTMLLTLVIDFDNSTFENVGVSLIALFYPTGLLIPLLGINALGDYALGVDSSFIALFSVFVASCSSDTMAYVVGSIVRGKKLCEKISPKKTVAGAIGGLFGAMVGMFIFWLVYARGFIFADNATAGCVLFIVMGLICSVVTQTGDLIEGSMKRKLGVKDLGNVLPGHGGLLDRIDGIMLNSAIVYFIFVFIG